MLWLFLLLVVVIFLMAQQSGLFKHSFLDSEAQNQYPILDKSALDILNERYARGELDTNEYESMKEKLTT